MYEGTYLKDKKEGFGIFKWASGNIYRGQYKEDEREGIGEMRWVDGSCYIGQWERGIQHGYGRMRFVDGSVKEGLFENNIYKGPVTKSDIPHQLLKPLDIMSLAPKGVNFSAEICYWNIALPQSKKLPLELPLLKPSKSEAIIVKKIAKYLAKPLNRKKSCKPKYDLQVNAIRKRTQSNFNNSRRLSKKSPTQRTLSKQFKRLLKIKDLNDINPETKAKKLLRRKISIPSGTVRFNTKLVLK